MEWISVNDRLPETVPGSKWSKDDVLCCTKYSYHIGRTRSGKWVDMENRLIEVTHWQPLPSPPTE